MGIKEVSETLMRRLEMTDIGNNWGKERKCKCGEKETTEHLIECKIEGRKNSRENERMANRN